METKERREAEAKTCTATFAGIEVRKIEVFHVFCLSSFGFLCCIQFVRSF